MSPTESKSGTAAFRVRIFGMAPICFLIFVTVSYNALNSEVISFRYSEYIVQKLIMNSQFSLCRSSLCHVLVRIIYWFLEQCVPTANLLYSCLKFICSSYNFIRLLKTKYFNYKTESIWITAVQRILCLLISNLEIYHLSMISVLKANIYNRNWGRIIGTFITGSDKLNKPVAAERWDRAKIVCTQPYNKVTCVMQNVWHTYHLTKGFPQPSCQILA